MRERFKLMLDNIPCGRGKALDIGGTYNHDIRDGVMARGYDYTGNDFCLVRGVKE